MQTREWTGKDGGSRQVTEIVISDMIILDNKRAPEDGAGTAMQGGSFSPKATSVEERPSASVTKAEDKTATPKAEKAEDKTAKKEEKESEEVKPEDIPF